MKKTLYSTTTIILAIALFFNMSIACAPSDSSSCCSVYSLKNNCIRIASYNVLADSIGFDGLSVATREELFTDTVKSISPHVLCLQEVSSNWYTVLKKLGGNYKFTTPVRNRLCMCMTPILYDTQRLILINSGIQSYTCSFDSRIRCISWAYFTLKSTNKKFVVLNTHLSLFDKNQCMPLLQATQLVEFINKTQKKYNSPIFIAGDFNTKQRSEGSLDSSTYEYLALNLTDTRLSAKAILSGEEKTACSPINDYIFFTGNATIESYALLSLPSLKTVSDHFPIFADIILS